MCREVCERTIVVALEDLFKDEAVFVVRRMAVKRFRAAGPRLPHTVGVRAQVLHHGAQVVVSRMDEKDSVEGPIGTEMLIQQCVVVGALFRDACEHVSMMLMGLLQVCRKAFP